MRMVMRMVIAYPLIIRILRLSGDQDAREILKPFD
jgi:hypothetical protein